MMAAVTRTIGPLHLEDLEPHRFEDLVRQLIYDFKDWRKLEATGRSGADDGYDARGEERPWSGWATGEEDAPAEGEQGEQSANDGSGRMWLIQCKREKEIGPAKLVKYLTDTDLTDLYGVVFAAACDFSKTARDKFGDAARAVGLSEAHLWGKAEIEDLLFQPKNDHLLFAYFGISLAIRKRSSQARLRSQTTIKRKLKRAFESGSMALIRDADDTAYPYATEGQQFDWWVYPIAGLTWRGLECVTRRYFAFIQHYGDTWYWDYANALNDGAAHHHDDPWRGKHIGNDDRHELWAFWSALPQEQQAWLTVKAVMPFDNILEVDELGDDITSNVHLYVRAARGDDMPFTESYPELISTDRLGGGGEIDSVPENRVRKFPEKFRRPFPFQDTDDSKDAPPPAAPDETALGVPVDEGEA